MIKDNIKNTAIIYKGYDYQNLFGVKILADWLHNPSKYKKILFEATIDADETPQALDDIICVREDNKYDYYQVKYTPSPEKEENYFTWDWFLKKAGKTERSRSIFKKIYDAYKRIQNTHIQGSIKLITNKRLSTDIESCVINEEFIDFNLIPFDIQKILLEQVDDEIELKSFFSILQIHYDDPNYTILDNQVKTSLMKVTDEIGFYRLKDEAKKWATIQNCPAPNGWITLDIIRSVVNVKRPIPVTQSFYIPDSYVLPNLQFHEDFYAKAINVNTHDAMVLTGNPGLGKSTYLSYLCKKLEDNSIPYVRHHYFLSTSDRTIDRLSLRVIAESLYSQINNFHQPVEDSYYNQPEKIIEVLKKCALDNKEKGKPFILIIDGIDHVWRDNHKNISPLDELFKLILPLPENLKIIIGTQLVDDEYLPTNFLAFCPKKDWINLPSMSGNAIQEYVTNRVKDGALIINEKSNTTEIIAESSMALLERTGGYPLQLIYACEYIKSNQLSISKWEIEQLPMQSGGDIEQYYLSIWHSLSHKQKQILHLIVQFPFFWPRNSFNFIFSDPSLNINSVIFLLHESLSGLRPFHESLNVFIKKIDNHSKTVNDLLEPMCSWLKEMAPESLRQSWLWHCQALLGDSMPLRKGLSRDWIIKRLVEGYDPQLFIDLLTQAEIIAFNSFQYGEAYKHRALKHRLLNGPQYQLDDFNQFKIILLTTAPNSVINEFISISHQLSVTDLAILSISLRYRLDTDTSSRIAELCYQKFKSEERLFISSRFNNAYDTNLELMLRAKILSDEDYVPHLLRIGALDHWSKGLITLLYKSCMLNFDLENILNIFHHIDDVALKNEISEEFFLLGSIEEINFHELMSHELLSCSSLGSVVKAFEQQSFIKSYLVYTEDEQHIKICSEKLIYSYKDRFFDNLSLHLSAKGDFCNLVIDCQENKIKESLYNLLFELSTHVIKLLEVKIDLTFNDLYSILDNSDLPTFYAFDDQMEINRFKAAWFEICLILHICFNKQKIPLSAFSGVEEKEFFNIYKLIDWYPEKNIILFEDDLIDYLFNLIDNLFSTDIQETNERCKYYFNLARIALLHKKSEKVRTYTFKCWDLILGYGWRKDTGIFRILDSIKYLSTVCPNDSILYLKEIAPVTAQLLEFTDGKETRHALPQFTDLLSKIDISCLTFKFEDEISQGSWNNAEKSFNNILNSVSDLSSNYFDALCKTGLSDDNLFSLKKNQNFKRANELITIALNHTGGSTFFEQYIQKEDDIKKTQHDQEEYIRFQDYPLEEFPEFFQFVRLKYENKRYLLPWLTYWIERKPKSLFIKYIWNYIKDDDLKIKIVSPILESLYQIAKNVKGKNFAFDILLKAQLVNNGWENYWYESEEYTFKRLDIIVKDYNNRADEFIKNTAFKEQNLTVPSSRLVYFLIKLNRLDEAKYFIEMMIQVLKEETKSLNLKKVDWGWNRKLTNDEIARKLLISRLHIPISAIKQWAANELSTILIFHDHNHELEQELLLNLEKKTLESEVIEILCVFLISSRKGYRLSKEIGKYINARSELSDSILDEIDSNISNHGNYIGDFKKNDALINKEYNFRRNLGREFPFVFMSTLEDLEKNTGYPLTNTFKHEWNKTFLHEEKYQDSYEYFLQNEHTGLFFTLNTHRAISAYLRTIEVAKREYNMPLDLAKILAVKALPVEPSYFDYKSHQPCWFVKWDHQQKYDITSLQTYLKKIINTCNTEGSGGILGALSFPIKFTENFQLNITCKLSNNETVSSERSCLFSLGGHIKDELIIFTKLSQISETNFPFVDIPYPINRYARWFMEQDVRGIYAPLIPNEHAGISVTSEDNLIKYVYQNTEIAISGYWNEEWGTSYPVNLQKPYCATYTLLKDEYFDLIKSTKHKTPFYTCTLEIISRKENYDKYESTNTNIELFSKN